MKRKLKYISANQTILNIFYNLIVRLWWWNFRISTHNTHPHIYTHTQRDTLYSKKEWDKQKNNKNSQKTIMNYTHTHTQTQIHMQRKIIDIKL